MDGWIAKSKTPLCTMETLAVKRKPLKQLGHTQTFRTKGFFIKGIILFLFPL